MNLWPEHINTDVKVLKFELDRWKDGNAQMLLRMSSFFSDKWKNNNIISECLPINDKPVLISVTDTHEVRPLTLFHMGFFR